MANTTLVHLKVKSLSKYGFFTAESTKGYNYSPKLSEADKARIVPGFEFDGDVYVSEKGAQYLNKIVGEVKPVVTDVTPPVDTKVAPKFVPKFTKTEAPTNGMTKAEWQAKDRSQLIGGLSHDAATIAVAVLNLDGSNEPGTDSALRVYRTLLEGMLKIREELK